MNIQIKKFPKFARINHSLDSISKLALILTEINTCLTLQTNLKMNNNKPIKLQKHIL